MPATTTLQVITDAHCGAKAEGYGSERKLTEQAPHLLKNALAEGQGRGAQAVLDLGDLIEHYESSLPPQFRAGADLRNFEDALRCFEKSGLPHYHCLGNHPLMAATQEMLLRPLGLDKPYYCRDIGEHRIVMLHSRFRHPDGSGIHIDKPQLDWLKRVLETADKPVLVCCHHPISDQNLRGNHWFENHPQSALMENRKEVQEVLASSGKVVAVFNGHTHWNHLAVDQCGTPHVTLQSLCENFRGDGTPSATYGIATLKGAAFNLEIHGNDTSLRNSVLSPQQIVRDLELTYDSIATVYDQKTSQYGAAERAVFAELTKMLMPGHKETVVDFGCGPGRDVPFYSSQGFKTVGVDASSELLAIARQRSPLQKFVHGDFATVELPKNSASIAIHSSTLQHVPRAGLEQALKKVFDTLEPGGVFYSIYRSGHGESLSISTEYGTPIARFIALYTQEEMEASLRKVGFDIIKSDTFDHYYDGLKGVVVQYKTRTFARKPGSPPRND